MDFTSDIMPSMPATGVFDASSPLSKRRKFTPPLPFGDLSTIHSIDNSDIENHTFSSPILPQLSSQAPTPEEIEASLLQVGMRIRKSVNDGYRNSPQKKFTPRPFANNLHRLSPETQKALLSGNMNDSSSLGPYSAGGLHNVGSMAMQPLSTATFCGINLAALSWSADDCSSVQEQSLWSYSTSHKRGYEGDSDSDESQDWQPQTPTLMPENGMPVDYFNIGYDTSAMSERNVRGRRIARPRTRIARQQMHPEMDMQMPPMSAVNPFASLNMEMMQQHEQQPIFRQEQQPEQQLANYVPMGHKRMLSCGMETNMDFGDAPFLQRREDVDMDCS
jgi:hypothetical protein